ncbi:hypothetical protein ACHAWX_001955 [Stephanocyclus meneghinianus]
MDSRRRGLCKCCRERVQFGISRRPSRHHPSNLLIRKVTV